MALTLEHSATTQSLEAWGMSNPVLSVASLSVGTLVADIAGDQIATLAWDYLDPVILRSGDTVLLRGWAGQPQRRSDGINETIQCTFVDPWFWLTDGVFSQENYDGVAEVARVVARIALFASMTPGTGWTQQTAAEAITTIVEACNTYHGGDKMQMGTFSGSFTISPAPQENSNTTFEGALRNVLAWVPDAVQQWDYSTTPPTLNFVRRGSATSRTRAHFGSAGSLRSDFTPRHDLVKRGVRITYVYNDASGAAQVAVDAAGETSGVGIVQATIVSIAAATDRDGGAPDSNASRWWAKHGGLGALATDISVRAGTNIAIDPSAAANAGHSSLDGCDNWIVGGEIPGWLNLSSHFRIALVTGYLMVRVELAGGGYRVDRKIVALRLPCTDLGSNTYTNTLRAAQTIGAGGTLAVPGALAAQLLAAMSTLHHSGQWVSVGEECDFDLRLGDVLNLTGGLTAWETFNAQIQQVSHSLADGVTTVQVGPPEHLAIQDFLQSVRVLKVASASWINRAAGGGPL
jgi:hypothetical protein